MSLQTVKDLLGLQLGTIYSAELQLLEALPLFAVQAEESRFSNALVDHCIATQSHIKRLESCFVMLDLPVQCRYSHGMNRLLEKIFDRQRRQPQPQRKAALAIGCQRLEAFELVLYDGAKVLSVALELEQVTRLIDQTMFEERYAEAIWRDIVVDDVQPEAFAPAEHAYVRTDRMSRLPDPANAMTR